MWKASNKLCINSPKQHPDEAADTSHLLTFDVCDVQQQRQLQLKLEAHGRYITQLIEQQSLQQRLKQQVHTNPEMLAALGRHSQLLDTYNANAQALSSAQTSAEQTHFMPTSGSSSSRQMLDNAGKSCMLSPR